MTLRPSLRFLVGGVAALGSLLYWGIAVGWVPSPDLFGTGLALTPQGAGFAAGGALVAGIDTMAGALLEIVPRGAVRGESG